MKKTLLSFAAMTAVLLSIATAGDNPAGGFAGGLLGAPVSVDQGRSRDAIQRVVMQNMGALRHAYNRYLYNRRQIGEPELGGKIAVKFKIDGFGRVIEAQVAETTMNDPEFETVIVERVKSWDFGKVDNLRHVAEVTYPFVFTQ